MMVRGAPPSDDHGDDHDDDHDDDHGVGELLRGTRFGPVHWFPQLDSTNRYAHDAVLAGTGGAAGTNGMDCTDGLVVVADRQTAGRGRLGRTWEAPVGASLLVSVVVRVDDARDDASLVTPAAALAAADALADLAGIDARLKWPNDLVVDDRKLAGILAEAVATGRVVVGMGVNVHWNAFPDELASIATACNFLSDRPVDRAELLASWLTRYDATLHELTTADGRARLRDACAARSATLGRRVRVELPGRVFEGTATGLAPNGMLEVTRDDGTLEAVAAGDVVHLRPAP
jgi:BirA family biotin operon repressor/biotin-[acetyl-CoA-carboxylase] ligase